MEIECWIRSHEHPVRLEVNGQYSCDTCTGFRVHKSSAEKPRQIRHPFHPHSLLTWTRDEWMRICSNCINHKEADYTCSICEYKLCSECALMPLATSGSEGQDWIRDLHHVHPLLCVSGDQCMKCIACKSSQRHQDDLYGCYECEYFLHKSCSRRPPQKLHLPIHRCNRTLILNLETNFRCYMCSIIMKDGYNLAYSCKKCSFQVCFKCAEFGWTSKGSFKYVDHDHLLCLIEDTEEITWDSQCDSYDEYCSQSIVKSSAEFRRTASTLLWCYQCGFRVHLLCGPLPSSVKYELHIHSLVLVDSMCEDDSGEYYCDICETKRDPLIRLYCCEECKYYAHVHCLLPEIVKLVGGDLKNVLLKTVNQDLWNHSTRELQIEEVDSTLTLKDIINQLSEYEKALIRSHYKWGEETISGDNENKGSNNKSSKVGDEEIDEILQLSHFTHRTFDSFWNNLIDFFSNKRENKVKMELKGIELAMKVVKVRGYMIPYSLAPLLNKLRFPYWNRFILYPKRSIGFESFALFIVCKVVKSMHTTVPKGITKSLLQQWFYHLSFAKQYSNFVDVRFAWAQLRELLHVFLGYQAERLSEEIPTALTERIAELQRKLDELYRIRRSSPESKYMKFCSSKVSEYKWKPNAFGGSLRENLNYFYQESDKD